MQCPVCRANNDRVVDSRSTEGGVSIRRRRECAACGRRFTTFERPEEGIRLFIIKKDGSRAPYQRSKVLAGIVAACHKQPVTAEAIESIADQLEEELVRNFDREAPSHFIGERLAAKLRSLDRVAYVRFASVYREFRDVGDFIETAEDALNEAAREVPGQQDLFD